jgi:predicted AlkP superfamily phosphohydrolase/phosphomutase
MVWEREQLKAAIMAEQIDKAVALIEEHRHELSDAQIKDIHEHVQERKKDIEEFVLKAKLKFVNKLAAVGVEPTFTRE